MLQSSVVECGREDDGSGLGCVYIMSCLSHAKTTYPP